MRYSNSVQGIRGFCVLAVLLFHFVGAYRSQILSGAMPGGLILRLTNVGWTGVDIFFGISGFVVTLIILENVRKASDIYVFLMRRAYRLFPVYYAAMLVLLCAASPLARSYGITGTESIWRNQWWAWLQMADVLAAVDRAGLGGVYISAVHLWSLSVEVQFYLIWPWLFIFLSEKSLIKIIPCIVLSAIIARICATLIGINDNAIYSLMPMRIDAFAFSSWLAILYRSGCISGVILKILKILCAGCAVIVYGYLFSNPEWHKADPVVQILGYGLLSIFSGCLVLLAYSDNLPRRLRQILSSRPIVWAGNYSYGIYIWHLIFAGLVSSWLRLAFLGAQDAHWTTRSGLMLDVAVNICVSLLIARLSGAVEIWGLRRKPKYVEVRGVVS